MAGPQEDQREAFEAYLLTKLEDDDTERSTREGLTGQRARFKAYFDAPPQLELKAICRSPPLRAQET